MTGDGVIAVLIGSWPVMLSDAATGRHQLPLQPHGEAEVLRGS